MRRAAIVDLKAAAGTPNRIFSYPSQSTSASGERTARDERSRVQAATKAYAAALDHIDSGKRIGPLAGRSPLERPILVDVKWPKLPSPFLCASVPLRETRPPNIATPFRSADN